jgi:hypothetical protein
MERWKDGKMERWKDGKMEQANRAIANYVDSWNQQTLLFLIQRPLFVGLEQTISEFIGCHDRYC